MMDIAHAFVHWCNCDGDEEKCEKCPLHDPDPDQFSICDAFNHAAIVLEEAQRQFTPSVYPN